MDIRIHPKDTDIKIDATLAFKEPSVIGIIDDHVGFEINVCVEDIPELIEMLQSIVEGK